MQLDYTPTSYVFALDPADAATVAEIREAAAAKAGSEYLRAVCLGLARLSIARPGRLGARLAEIAKGAWKLLAAEADARGFEVVACVAADRCNHWGLRRKA